MNPKRLILSIIVVFVALFAMDFVIHGFIMAADYKKTPTLWRTDEEMGKHFHWLLLYQFVCAFIFTVIWAKAFANWGSLSAGAVYGSLMGAFFHSSSFVTHAVSPLPSDIMAKWLVAGIVEMTLLGVIVYSVYKPLPTVAAARA